MIIQRCYRDRLPLPNRIKNAPDLWLGLEFFYVAFLDLDSERPTGWNIGRIPWSAIDRYASYLGLIDPDDEQRGDLFYLVRSLDSAFVEYHIAEGKKKKKKA